MTNNVNPESGQACPAPNRGAARPSLHSDAARRNERSGAISARPGDTGAALPRAARPLAALVLLAAMMFSGAEAADGRPDSTPVAMHRDYQPGTVFMGVRLLGAVELTRAEVDGVPLAGLSALAWDDDRGLLYAVSDYGYLFHLAPSFEQGHLAEVRAVAGYRLRGPDGRPLTGLARDAEGALLLDGRDGRPDTGTLVVSFEQRPRVLRFTRRGEFIAEQPIPPEWVRPDSYRSANKALEAIANHPRWGLLSGPELPPGGAPDDNQDTIFALDGRAEWHFARHPVPEASLVAMETLADGGLLTLERAYVSESDPMYIVLRRSKPLPPIAQSRQTAQSVDSSLLAEFNSAAGWRLDNFEGLTRHQRRRFFMVSDDNARSQQRTLLWYLELLPPRAAGLQAGPGE